MRYLNGTGTRLADLDSLCTIMDNSFGGRQVPTGPTASQSAASQPAAPTATLNPSIASSKAVVKELLSERSGILQDPGRKWMCFFTSSHALLPGNRPLKQIMPAGTAVMVNAKLINAKKSIQYLATLVWDSRDFAERDLVGRDIEPDQQALQNYFQVNEIFAGDDASPAKRELPSNGGETPSERGRGRPATAANAEAPVKRARVAEGASGPDPASASDVPDRYVAAEGKIYRLLDANFGIIRAGDHLILFDNCDFYVDSGHSISKKGLTLSDVVRVGDQVRFHACRVESRMAKMQYLATSVWKTTVREFIRSPPPAFPRSGIHQTKLDIFKQVLDSVGSSLPVFGTASSLLLGKAGVVDTIFLDERGSFLGGVLKVSGAGANVRCAFVTGHVLGTAAPQVGFNYKVNLKRVAMKTNWSDKVSYVALNVYPSSSSTMPEESINGPAAVAKYKGIIDKFTAVHEKFSLAEGSCPLAAGGKKSLQPRFSQPQPARAAANRPPQPQAIHPPSSTATATTTNRSASPPRHPSAGRSTSPSPPPSRISPEEKVSYAFFKCMTSLTTGIMADFREPSCLIYFELEDVIGVEKRKIKTVDIVKLMSKMAGVKIRYVAVKMDSNKIGYACHQVSEIMLSVTQI